MGAIFEEDDLCPVCDPRVLAGLRMEAKFRARPPRVDWLEIQLPALLKDERTAVTLRACPRCGVVQLQPERPDAR